MLPTYDGRTPTKASDFQHDYVFSGWSPGVTAITGDTTYVAVFTASDIEKQDIHPVVTIANWTYGQTANVPSVSGNAGTGAVTYDYAPRGSGNYAATVPTNAGDYTVRATIAETVLYASGVATADFTIYKAIQTAPGEGDGYEILGYQDGTSTAALMIAPGHEIYSAVSNGEPVGRGGETITLPTDTPFYIRKAELENYNASPFTLSYVWSKVTVEAAVSPANAGTVFGTGIFDGGAQVTLTASAASGYAFVGWSVNGQTVGEENSYAFPALKSVTVEALFRSTVTQIAYPPAVSDFTYDGTEKIGIVAEGQNCVIRQDSATSAVNAGVYTIAVTPDTGYVWGDGSSGVRELTWHIRRATRNAPDVQADPGGAYAILGVDSLMEYRRSDESGYRKVGTLDEGASLTVDAGTWYVRYAETNNYFASPVTLVVVDTPSPDVKTMAPSSLTTDGATILGVATPARAVNGLDGVGFYYWLNDHPGAEKNRVLAAREENSSEFQAVLTGLSTNTEYVYQAFAVSGGTETLGEERIFRTAINQSLTPAGALQIEVYSSSLLGKDVVVSIEEGNVVLATQSGRVSQLAPYFPETFGNLPDGHYNIVVRTTDGSYAETRMISVTNGASQKVIFTVLTGRLVSAVNILSAGTPRAAVNGISSLFTEDEIVNAASGSKDVEVALNIERESDSFEVEGSQQIHATLSARQIVDFLLDLTLVKTSTEYAADGTETKVKTEDIGSVNTKVLEIAIPYTNTSRTDLTLVRYHDGVAKRLNKLTHKPLSNFRDGTFFLSDRYIFLYASKFSTYAVVYTVPGTNSDSGVIGIIDSNGSSGGGSSSSSGSSSRTSYHDVTVQPTENGTVTVSPSSARQGAKVSVVVQPDENFELDTLLVKDTRGKELKLTDTGNGTFWFQISSRDVTVTATFKAVSTDSGDGSNHATDPGDGQQSNLPDNGDNASATPDTSKDATVNVSECRKDDSCPLSKFADLDPTAWYHDGIHYVLETGMMQGYSDNTFRPNLDTSRAMIVTMLWRLEGEPIVEKRMNFTDVREGQWHTEAIRWAFANGIVTGYNDTAFGPQNRISRQQLVAILWRYAQYKGVDVSSGEKVTLNGFNDADMVSQFARSAVRWAVGEGIMLGRSDNTIDPYGSGTRAQSATILARFCLSVMGN